MRSTTAFVLAAVIGATVGGLLWLVALVGVANYTEKVCFSDLEEHSAYGAVRSAGSLWPPSFECRLSANAGPDLVVEHPLIAAGAFVGVVVLPMAYGVSASLALFAVLSPGTRASPGSFET